MMKPAFKEEILRLLIKHQETARWPMPLTLEYGGEPTDLARLLCTRFHHSIPQLEKAINKAIKELHEAGCVIFLERHGYVWIVSPSCYRQFKPEEVVDKPGPSGPRDWDPTYQVTVGNIGQVYDGTDPQVAYTLFHRYNESGAADEEVILWKDGEPIAEFHPKDDDNIPW
jgi:hypothetical protein